MHGAQPPLNPIVPPAGRNVDPAATQVLKRMTDYMGSLKQFSVVTQTNLEDTLSSGQRVDTGVSARVTVQRPNKLRAQRVGDLVEQ